MTREQFQNERAYLSTLSMLNDLRDRSLVTAEEYEQALGILSERYKPIIDADITNVT